MAKSKVLGLVEKTTPDLMLRKKNAAGNQFLVNLIFRTVA